MRSDRLIFLIGVFILAWFIAGCGSIDLPGGTPNNAPQNPPVGVVNNSAGFYVRYFENSKYTYYDHAGDTTITEPCTADLGELVTCYIEAQELDLYHHGLELQYNVPTDMCKYLRFTSYYYFHRPAGNGAGFVQLDTDSTGALGEDTNSNGFIDIPQTPCTFDYTSSTPPGPNCCEGFYQRDARQWDPAIPGYGPTVTTNGVSWGGARSNCAFGPAVDTHPKDEDNLPIAIDYFVEGTGINQLYTILGGQQKGFRSNVYAANYFPGAQPLPIQSPYYDFKCLDRGEEILSEIRVMVRDWDTSAAFDAILADPTNFNIPGNEPAPWNSFPFNDRFDWEDFGVSFPSNSQ